MLFAAKMGIVADYLLPILLLAAAVGAMKKHEDVYSLLIAGGMEGLQIVVRILPSLVMLLCAFHMLRASGAIDAFSKLLSPLVEAFGIPAQLLPLMLLRPISGSAALAIGADLMATHGVDSYIGICTAIMLGSTETTFYTISVYFGACGIRKTRYAIPAALCADLTGFIMACLSARILAI